MYKEIRSSIRSLILDVLGSFSAPKAGVHILNGHAFREFSSDSEAFKGLLFELSKKVTFVNFEDAVRNIVKGVEIVEPQVCFTFDDGYTDCKYIASILDSYSISACFFINPNYVMGDDAYIKHFNDNIVFNSGKYPMRWSDIEVLKNQGHIIGAHTMDHYMLNKGELDALDYQIKHCRNVIEEAINEKCRYFAFPYGRSVSYTHLTLPTKA